MISGKKCRYLNRDGVDIGKAEFEVLGFSTLPPACFCDTTPDPTASLDADAVLVDLVSTTRGTENLSNSPAVTQTTNSIDEPLVEATGWALDQQGQVVFTAFTTTTPPDLKLTSVNCHASQRSS